MDAYQREIILIWKKLSPFVEEITLKGKNLISVRANAFLQQKVPIGQRFSNKGNKYQFYGAAY